MLSFSNGIRTLANARCALALLLAAWAALFSGSAAAIPLFARQTGFDCSQCHTNFPQLTPFGRQFKLEGYTRSDPAKAPPIPIAAMTWFGVTTVENNRNPTGNPDTQFMPKNGALLWEGGSVFTGGRITDNIGGFTQWTYNNLAPAADGDPNHFSGHSFVDNTDIRAVIRPTWGSMPVVLGLTLNNAQTVQDVWNSTPAWGYPFKTSPIGPGFGASTFIESQPRLAGLGAYAWIDKKWYAEISGYKTADGAFSILTAGSLPRTRIKGAAPYWRFAYNWDGAENHITLGHFGTVVNTDPVDPETNGGVPDRFRDIGFDLQFQHFSSDDEKHIITAQATYIHESASWYSGFPNLNDAPYSVMQSEKLNVAYLYNRTYGITGALFNTTGNTDTLRFGTGGFDSSGNPIPGNGKPDTAGYIVELQWTPPFIKLTSDPQFTARFAIQYVGYWKFNGANGVSDASGRNASNNNTVYVYTWIAM